MLIARKKNPYIFKIYDERASLKFKSTHWLKKQVSKKASGKMILFKNLKQMLVNFDNAQPAGPNEEQTFNEELGSYMSIESGISVRVRPRYCDFTGFRNRYTHKETLLRFTQEQHCKAIEKMQNSVVQEILQNRKAVAAFK